MNEQLSKLEEYFSELTDPRIERRKLHKLIDIVVIAICATLARCEDFVEIAGYGEIKKEWLSSFLELPNGIPSHDTFNRVFRRLDPKEFHECFMKWVEALRKEISKEIVAVDGKTVKRAIDKATEESGLHIVSAWATENELSLGQVAVENKSNEIVAIPKLLALLELKDCIVTIDAIGCYGTIVDAIREKKADYVIAVKANQGNLYKSTVEFFKENKNSRHVKQHETQNSAHGRKEQRKYYITSNLEQFRSTDKFKDIKSIGMVESTRKVGDKISSQTRYFITNLGSEPLLFAKAVRSHWGIENSLHWVLDVVFREDYSRSRKENSAQNLAALRKIAINLAKADKSSKKSIKMRRLIAGLDDQYLLQLLTQNYSNLSQA